jgi:hypothetical protein
MEYRFLGENGAWLPEKGDTDRQRLLSRCMYNMSSGQAQYIDIIWNDIFK